MNSTLFLTLVLLIALVVLWVFYDKFTKRGAIAVDNAARDFTTYLGLAGVACAHWIIQFLQWVSGFWDQMQMAVGPALSAKGLDTALMLWSALMLALKFKGQLPRFELPDASASPRDLGGR